jgi:enamine deaminase RidA (YjgF/YER057c/UK114 family)
MTYHLATVNIARLQAPLESPQIADFRNALAHVNALAEASPGFVWRYIDGSGNATDTRIEDDPMLIYNMSVWESIESLKAYVYHGDHAAVYRRRQEWFHRYPSTYTCLWWVRAGERPSVTESLERLAYVDKHGITAHAFSFAKPFPPPDQRLNISTGASWEDIVGYSRAVRIGNTVEVAGTTAVDETGAVVGAGDPAEQTRFTLRKIERALIQAGASLRDVVRTRVFVTDITQWEAVGRVHGEFFGDIKPASSMLEISRLIDPALLVEIEASAIITVKS